MLTLHPLLANQTGDVAALQRVLDDAPAYCYMVKGCAPLHTDAEDVFNGLPPGLSAADKLVAGFLFNDQMVGFVDVCKGCPQE